MFEYLQNSLVVWVILSICTVLGVPSLIFAIYTWINSKQKKEFSSYETCDQIIEKNTIDKLNITYNEKIIYDLYVTKVAIWNSGNMTIKSDDIVSSRPLSIICNEGIEMLNAEIVNVSDKDNEFKVLNINTHAVEFGFNYISEKDGIVVKVLHTGGTGGLLVDCRIIDGLNIKNGTNARIVYDPIYWSWVRFGSWGGIILIIIVILGEAAGFSDNIFYLVEGVFMGVFIMSTIVYIYKIRKADQRFTYLSDVPRRLRISFERESHLNIPWYTSCYNILKKIWYFLINRTS